MSRPAAFACTLIALTASACATAPDAVTGPASYAAIATRPEPRAGLYADCIAQAAGAGTYGHASDDDSSLILFTCTGTPARVFYEGLAVRSAAIGSEFVSEGRTYRSTNRVERDLFGVDYCSTAAGQYQCVITLNAGEFLSESPD
ncbi:MAG: hypothetical protein V4701_04710 [Pseudomonadota bacterium]